MDRSRLNSVEDPNPEATSFLTQPEFDKIRSAFDNIMKLTLAHLQKKIIAASVSVLPPSTIDEGKSMEGIVESLNLYLGWTIEMLTAGRVLMNIGDSVFDKSRFEFVASSCLGSLISFAVCNLRKLIVMIIDKKLGDPEHIRTIYQSLASACGDVASSSTDSLMSFESLADICYSGPISLSRQPSYGYSFGGTVEDLSGCEFPVQAATSFPKIDVSKLAPGIQLDPNKLLVTSISQAVAVFADISYEFSDKIAVTGNYFEVTVISCTSADIGIGLSAPDAMPTTGQMPGWLPHSYGYTGYVLTIFTFIDCFMLLKL